MHIDSALLDIDIAAPDLIEQLAAGVGALLVGHEELQQTVFGGAHLGRFAVDGDAVADRIEQQAADLDRRFAVHWRRAAQHGLQAGDQLARREGLGDVVVGADFQALDLVVLFTLGGEHDDRRVGGQLVALEAARQLDARSAGQHPVEQDQVRLLVDDQCVGLLGVLCFETVIAGHFQGDDDHLPDRRLVIDDQYALAVHGQASGLFLSSGIR